MYINREIKEIRYRFGEINPINAITKKTPHLISIKFVNTNLIFGQTTNWVKKLQNTGSFLKSSA